MATTADIILRMRAQGKDEALSMARALDQAAKESRAALADFDRLERGQRQLATLQVQLARQTGEYSQALATVRSEMQAAGTDERRLIQLKLQEIAVERQAGAATASRASELQSFTSSLFSFASGAGLAAVGLSSFSKSLTAMREGFTLVAQIDATTRSLGVMFGSVQQGRQVMQQAQAFGERYGFTQDQINESLRAAVPILKATKAGTQDVLSVLARLAEIDPEQGLSGAAIAFRELTSGQTTSLVKRFEFSRDAANQLKKEIESGIDPVKALDAELNRMGATSDLLAERMKGPEGAINRLSKSSEDLKISLGRTFEAAGGVKAIGALTDVLNLAATGFEALSAPSANAGDILHTMVTNANESTVALQATSSAAAQAASIHGQLADALTGVPLALRDMAQAARNDAEASIQDQLQTEILNAKKKALQDQAQAAANAILRGGGDIEAEAARLAASSGFIDQLTASYLQLALAQRTISGALGGGVTGGAPALNPTNLVGGGARKVGNQGGFDLLLQHIREQRTAAKKESREAIRDAQKYAEDLAKSRYDLLTPEEKLADVRKRLANAGNEVERNRLLKEERDLVKQIADEQERQLKAALDYKKALLEDQDKRDEELRRAKEARRVLESQATTEDQRRRARRALQEIEIDQQERALALRKDYEEANGRVGALPAIGRPGSSAGAPAVPGALPAFPGLAAATGGAAGITVQVFVDGQEVASRMVVKLRAGRQQAIAAGTKELR